MKLLPSKKQWKDWTLPSKLTAIGVYVGIPLTLLLFIVSNILQPDLDEIVRRIAMEHKTVLNQKYPTAHAVFGAYQGTRVVPSGQMPKNLKIDWGTGKIQSTNNNVLIVTLPDIILNGNSFIGGNVTQIEKRIGAKSKPIIKLGWFNPRLEVIGIDNDLIVIALGFPKDDSEN